MKPELLYPDGVPLAALMRAEATPLAPDCTRCKLSTVTSTAIRCMGAVGAPGGVWVLGSKLGENDVEAGEPWSGGYGQTLRRVAEQAAPGVPVAWDVAIRCYTDGVDTKVIDACRTYSRHMLDAVIRPTRILALGHAAIRSVLGYTLPPDAVEGGFAWVGKVPVFLLRDPFSLPSNKWARASFVEAFRHAITRPIEDLDQHPAEVGWAKCMVSTAAEAAEAAEALAFAGILVYDVETVGHIGDPGFKIVSLSMWDAGVGYVYTFDRWACADTQIRPYIRALLTGSNVKSAQQGKFDMRSIYEYMGFWPNGTHLDTLHIRRLLHPGLAGSLDVLSTLAGQSGYKAEQEAEIKDAVKHIKKQNKAAGVVVGKKHNYKADAFDVVPQAVTTRYNARDVVATGSVLPHLLAELDLPKNAGRKKVWDGFIERAGRAAAQVESWGMPCDIDAVRRAEAALDLKIQAEVALLEGVNPASSPQMQAKLFGSRASGGLGLSPLRKTKAKQPSANAATIEELARLHPDVPFLGAVLRWRSASTLKGTFCTGVIPFIRADGRVHPTVNIDGTETGRLSCKDPNLYNIPKSGTEAGKWIRDFYWIGHEHQRPRGWAGLGPMRMVAFDYSQLELRIAAMLSGDEFMIAQFRAGVDFHMATAELLCERAWNIPRATWDGWTALAALNKDNKDYDDPRKHYRSLIKPVVFGLLYGKGDETLAEDMHCSVKEAATIRHAIYGEMPGLARWIKSVISQGIQDGGAYTYWNGEKARFRPIPDAGHRDEYRASAAERLLVNTPVQGTASDYGLASQVELVEWIQRERFPAQLCVSVYDSLIFLTTERYQDELSSKVKDVMQNRWYTAGIPLVADEEDGIRWGSLHKTKRG